ncbi:MAG: hypothetical protein RLN88_00255 [Ekhidna sp.]|uniref:hypothetical protein n=1 Tax=Ekhidna sp. TaxID=2608089 RepID=UPI0032EF14F6
MIRYYLIVVVSCTLCFPSFSQVDADLLTGAVTANLPIHTIQTGSFNVPIGVSYGSNGLRVNSSAGDLGLSWQFNVGGSIYREIRGLPDEYKGDTITVIADSIYLYDNRVGWLHNSTAEDVGEMEFTADDDYSTWTDEAGDYAKLEQLGKMDSVNGTVEGMDAQPDIFHLNAPGISCSFVYTNDNVIITEPYQDLLITPQFNQDSSSILSFRIVDNAGNSYEFGFPSAANFAVSMDTTDFQVENLFFPRYFNERIAPFYPINTTWNLLSKTPLFTSTNLSQLRDKLSSLYELHHSRLSADQHECTGCRST